MAFSAVIGVLYNFNLARFAAIAFSPVLFQLAFIPIFMAIGFFVVVWNERTVSAGSPRLWLKERFKKTGKAWDDYIASPHAADALAALMPLMGMSICFCTVKSVFYFMAWHDLDHSLSQLDYMIHGKYPHEYLLPLAQKYNLERAMEVAYIVWFPVMMIANSYAIFFDKDTLRRKQYLWGYTLSWIVCGTLLALIFYSVGPIFYNMAQPSMPDPYVGLRSWLSTANNGDPAFMFNASKEFYDIAVDNIHPDVNGVSAMPSLHVGICWLNTLYGFRLNRWLGIVLALFTGVIMISSVTLGWHYAVDGYVCIAVMTVLWYVTGSMLRRYDRRQESI